jgi:hypothetical protein
MAFWQLLFSNKFSELETFSEKLVNHLRSRKTLE